MQPRPPASIELVGTPQEVGTRGGPSHTSRMEPLDELEKWMERVEARLSGIDGEMKLLRAVVTLLCEDRSGSKNVKAEKVPEQDVKM